MDKPLGPRQPPPDKRHAAYESIFGRPGPPPQVQQPHRNSYQPPLYSQPPRTSYYPPPNPSPYPSFPPVLSPSQNQPVSGFRSLHDPALTPAQAYQAQVYMNAPAPAPSHWAHSPPPHSERSALGVSLEHDDGRFGIDFTVSNSSDLGTDEGSSELPWTRSEPASMTFFFYHAALSHSIQLPTIAIWPHLASISVIWNLFPPCVIFFVHFALFSFLMQVLPLHVDTMAARSSMFSSSPSPSSNADHSSSASTTLLDHGAARFSTASSTLLDHSVARRSTDSVRTVPKFSPNPQRRDRTTQDRSMSMSAAQQKRSSQGGRVSPTSLRSGPVRKTPIVYPALLSRVAQAFHERIPITDRIKDGLTYKDAFDGREAVDKIAYIIKTTDRNLALLLGRALDAQKFFHDVTYDHRLRDSANELYQFRTRLPSPFVSGELEQEQGTDSHAFFEVCDHHNSFMLLNIVI